MDVASLPDEVPGYEVNLENVAVWIIREMRLHGSLPDDIVFNLKVDGRPFFGNWMAIIYNFALIKKNMSVFLKVIMAAWIIVLKFYYITGKDQAAVGIVPLDAKHRSSQSAKSVYPLAIANCKEKR